ncbi:hypothetical protein GPJ56_003926 [Histomonas meleagridis]|uniref:uncharacterized protein n=1 Tax=Histomonas meleagridis TaxID=135588 RepID=UPI0035593769|nr:hypothetical protein GPJ56_003926 [Histomonas meleagridis]KAH0797531.1 hypothetical protein GO595_009634 [Histomonas meleagridis]
MSEQKEKNTFQDFDTQHDDEFEDFKVGFGVKPEITNAQQGDYLDDWDDDVVENFTEILNEQRRLLQ